MLVGSLTKTKHKNNMKQASSKKTDEQILRDLVFDDKGKSKMLGGYDNRIPVRLPSGKAVEVWFTQKGTLNFSHPIRKRKVHGGFIQITHQIYYFSKDGTAKKGEIVSEKLEEGELRQRISKLAQTNKNPNEKQ